MAYTPPRQKSQFDIGERVIGKFRPIKVNGERGVKVLWRTDEGETKSAPVLLSECAESVQEDVMQIVKNNYDGELQVSFNTDKSAILFFHPANGQFKVTVDNFPSGEDEPPKPKVKTGKWGDYMQFIVIVRIVKGKCKGITLPILLRYDKFEPEQTEEGLVTGYAHTRGASPHCDFLDDFCEATGVWEFGPIEWKQNILPDLEKRILRLEREFNIMMRDGWVDTIYPIYDYEDDEASDPVKEEMPWLSDEEEQMEVSQDEPEEEDEEMMGWPEE